MFANSSPSGRRHPGGVGVMRRAGRIKPIRQGGLDCLCGIYAIINALRLILNGDNRIKTKDYEQLFEKLIYRLQELSPESVHSIEGIGTIELRQLLAETIDYLEEEFEVEVELTRPLLGSPRIKSAKAIGKLRAALARPGTAVLIGFGGLEHWTVVRAITDHHFLLLDSSGRRFLRTRRSRMIYERRRSKRSAVIIRGAAFAVRKL
jgi:hypothetical protein